MRSLYRWSVPVVFVAAGAALLMGSKPAGAVQELELQKIVLKGSNGSMILDASAGAPTVRFIDASGKTTMQLLGGDNPSVSLYTQKQNEMIQIALVEEGNPVISLKDGSGVSRMQFQGGDAPAVFLKNGNNEIIATMLTLQDGGAAVGLADKDGDVAAFMRGGASPSISFFQKSTEPLAAIGISQKVPHLLVTSPATRDNLVLHGGDPTSVLFVDEQGEIPVLLSKHGLFQGKKQASPAQSSAEEKIFTWDELLNPLRDVKLNKR